MKNGLRFLQIIAAALALLSLGVLISQRFRAEQAQALNAEIAAQITALLPENTDGSPADYSNQEMPVLQLGGIDYVCLLEVPSMGIRLPVCNQWQPNELKCSPCRFWGSIYDGTCILGGSHLDGQFDFCSRLELGDQISVTDMRGTTFRCRVQRIDRTASADFSLIYDKNYPLTLFVRDKYDARYIVVRCAWAY